MPAGTLENTSGGSLTIDGFGWILPTSHTETVDELSESQYTWTRAAVELSAKITAGDIVIRDENSNVIVSAEVLKWINATADADTPLAPQVITLVGIFDVKVSNNGILWLNHSGNASQTESGFILAGAATLRTISLSLNIPDAGNTYDLRLYSDPAGTPAIEVQNELTTTTGAREFSVEDLNIAVPAGEYGMRLDRASGAGKSDFDAGLAHMIFELD